MPTRHVSAYSYRAKLGLIVPPTNTVNEAEWAQLMPAGVTFHTHRMPLHGAGQDEALMADLSASVALLAQSGADAVAYACTAGSMTVPASRLPEAATGTTGHRVLTTSAALIEALRALGAERISIATPYAQAVNDHEVEFLSAHGIETLAIAGLGIGSGGPHEFVQIARTPLEEVRKHAVEIFDPASDALLIACTDFPTLPLIPDLEATLGVPVVTSNQATLWAMLRAVGIGDHLPGAGRLFAEH
ncbi:Putative decarboxylase [Pseudooceanicola batsensis HTCC2597]|uniref:Putative decarboxylase n=1 Tax=Pseudooceanicola batsensis (strain ATCC BAA-863 / DSM 15984 / KCTC 12145 / HTCC2597) TaxID=252305 RepID=A3U0D8_PSEBH|nr:aspartate/glutamate racemase family protein [Pseudooceanicola batsensis]EAQ02229.1 Putative decarboxylase [Pseudooceanicola batsensis HTCC2597]